MSIFKTLLVSLYFITGPCFGGKAQMTPLQLNNYIADISDSLYYYGGEWGTRFVEGKETKVFTALTSVRMKILQYVERKKMDVLLLKDVNESQSLRLAMLEYLFFQQMIINEAFTPFEKLGKDVSDELLQKQVDNLQVQTDKEEAFTRNLLQVQKEYARKNNIRLE